MSLVLALRAETPPGLCPYCDRPLPRNPYPGPKRKSSCGRLECVRAWDRDRKADQRIRKAQQTQTSITREVA